MALRLSAVEKKQVEAAQQAYADAATDFNAKRSDFHQLLTEIIDNKRSEFDSKSERWQESEKGEAANAWIEALEEIQGELENAEVTSDEFEINEAPDA